MSKRAKQRDSSPTGLRITAGVLGFAAEFVSKEETRYYVNGVYIEPAETGVLAVATDGHRVVAVHDAAGFIERPAIIRAKARDLAWFRHAYDATLSADSIGERATNTRGPAPVPDDLRCERSIMRPIVATFTLPDGGAAAVHLDEIDAEFPDWRHAFPTHFPRGGVLPAFQARYLAAFDGLARVGGFVGAVRIIARGEAAGAVVVPAAGSHWPWVGVLMPIRAEAPPLAYPSWLGLVRKKVRVKARSAP